MTAVPPDPRSLQGAGAFQLVEILGSGAFGTVCVARDCAHPERPLVVLKVLRSSYVANTEVLRRTRDEARMLKRLRHPNIVRVHWLMSFQQRPVLGMERVHGLAADHLLRAVGGPLDEASAIEIIRRSAHALDAAYYSPSGLGGRPMHIIHRDIKPANLMISAQGQVKVTDFGQAKGDFVDRETITRGFVFGSRGYMAPERVAELEDSPAGDVYALGLCLFELLTSRRVVVSIRPERHHEGMARHRDHLPDGLPQSLRQLFASMCAYDPLDRPAPGAIARELAWIQADHGLPTTLHTLASRWIQPTLRARTHRPPREHPDYDEVRFLEHERGELVDVGRSSAEKHQARAAVARLLAHPDWHLQQASLQRHLAAAGDWVPEALIDVLQRAEVRWWNPLVRPARADQLLVAMQLLREAGDPRVRQQLQELISHRNPRVRQLARRLSEARP